MIEAASVGRSLSYSATGLDRLAQALHYEFDVLRLQMPPAFNLSLVAILREALKVFRSVLAGGVALPREFLADERVCWHNLPSTPEIFKLLTNENGPRCGTRAGLDGAARCGSERLRIDLETPPWSLRSTCANAVSDQLGNWAPLARIPQY